MFKTDQCIACKKITDSEENLLIQKYSGPALKIQQRRLRHTNPAALFTQIESNRWQAVFLYTVFLETAIWVDILFKSDRD